jgi:phospho-N-acetylmuramoyl-pentapeptide-transferase
MDLMRDWLIDSGIYSATQIFDREHFRAIISVLFAFTFVLILGKPVIRWLRRKKIGDSGLADAAALSSTFNSKKHTPTMGGILIIGAILITTLLFADMRNFYVQLACIVGLWLAVLGGFDDWLKLTAASRKTGSRQGLYSWEKLVFQLGLGILVGYFAYTHGQGDAETPSLAHVLNLPFQRTFEPGTSQVAPGLVYLPKWLYIIIAMLMITGMSNAANITDGMDGLAGGVSAIVSLGLLVLCAIAGWQVASQYLLLPYVVESGELAVVAGAMGGACLGFLWYNCSPASVFMGDTGSLSLGGLIGYLALISRQEVLVLFMCAIFLLEIGSVVLQVGCFKLTGGKRIFKCAPYHHHLHLSDWTEQQVVARFWFITVLLVLLSLASLKVR